GFADLGQQLLGRDAAHLATRLAHRGETRPDLARSRRVVEAEHGHFVGNLQAALAYLVHHAAGAVVVGGEDRGRRVGQVEQPPRADDAGFERKTAVDDERFVVRDAGAAQPVAIAGQAPSAAAVRLRTGD